ncbi:beta-galactosidase-like [Ornithodoros turicata]|uniref:beta-galactosidase-like n=1 Tax=Ornithodoros turicata TaxID=34597 RepID=UPI00313A3BCB
MHPWLFVLLGAAVCSVHQAFGRRSFTVDYENDRFLKDGEPFRYVSGSMHYFRVPKPYWRDRLHKMRMAGLNAVQTYVEWSRHEPEPGKYNFEENYDLPTFLRTAHSEGLLVILRPGPYICAERDNGGLPYWLLRLNPHMKYRTSDKTYIAAVDRWMSVLLPLVKPFLYNNGGPIITVQVENEYGQYCACDHSYMEHLASYLWTYLGEDVILFRTDIPNMNVYECDAIDGALVTADFNCQSVVSDSLEVVREAQGRGPLIVTEYYTGWMDHWGRPHVRVDHDAVLSTFEQILKHNASVNFYMYHGGTNFGFSSGSNAGEGPQVTSYDYGAPLSEAGDPTDLYYKIRAITGKYLPLPHGQVPKPSPKYSLDRVNMTCGPSLDEVMDFLRRKGRLKTANSVYPMSFEEFGQGFGYVSYTTTVPFQSRRTALLDVPGIKDRGYVFTRYMKAVLSSWNGVRSVPVVVGKGETLKIIVENTGRINYGAGNHDPKGILSNVTLDGEVLTNWTMEAVPIPDTKFLNESFDLLDEAMFNDSENCSAPRFYFGKFSLHEHEEPLDTFLDPTGWTRGVAFMNEWNLGRYWPMVGPQVTLYVPGAFIKPHMKTNVITLVEMEDPMPGSMTVTLTNVPELDGPTPVKRRSHGPNNVRLGLKREKVARCN